MITKQLTGVGNFQLEPLDLAAHFDLLCDWMHQPHVVPYWELNKPHDEIESYLVSVIESTHSQSYVGLLDGRPMSYWELYWTAPDRIADYYEVQEADQGIHLLIGPPEDTGRGLGVPLLHAVTEGLFLRSAATQRVIAEPDVRNDRVLKVFQRVGFEKTDEFDLPEKRAALMMCVRSQFQFLE